MTTLLISEIFPPRHGGSGRWFWEIYRRLPRADFLIAAGEDPQQESYDRAHDLRIVRMPLTLQQWGIASLCGLQGYTRAILRLRRLAAEHHVTAIHSGRCLPEGIMALALRHSVGIPYACYVHGEDVNTATLSREHHWLARRVLGGAHLVIANSRNTERILRQEWGLPVDRVRVLHPGVDTDRFVPAPRDAAVRARLGWGDRPVILTVGRLQQRKGHDRMIEAVGKVRRTIPDVLYSVVGGGEERDRLGELTACAGLAGHVQFLGELADEDLIRCYQQCDMFTLPNRQVGKDIEGFGMVLLEAQACGKPVIAGNSGGTAETMKIPETGWVVAADDPAELAESIINILSDRGRMARMGLAARAWVSGQFSWDELAPRAGSIFREMVRCRSQDTCFHEHEVDV
ncbi:glycosyltransferase family 4 protein [Tautonia plasticadhaerens]|uniref:GDP-mannose-dependent alpha-(1-6)-phosphatidylinositol monomannoside mannosyltransferase n=1 Tax=Tautonia plasticadhaerens TaxID=2527974 RepID=A0A518HFT7_9BACT|nr:glycosyltransferase family 4 protein [Tautonia plasticadhaerens]QDV39711.1 GDP-mannose-dependent alpha-(1-6)-phosphatidylinositol monomannoside mannosyltransferase [Tautonia plasticadhaerens]